MTNLYNGNTGKIIPFEKCLGWMDIKGKELFGNHFTISKNDHELIFKLLVYIYRDAENAKKHDISLEKGLLISGPVGAGKTTIMTLLRLFQPQMTRYVMKSCRDVSFEFIQEGYSVILRYSRESYNQYHQPKVYCFDDIGTENSLKYFGNDCNVMAEILLSRYDLFYIRRMVTHLTTNLTSGEIEEIYGTRVRSRMREMCNLISFDKNSSDKRV